MPKQGRPRSQPSQVADKQLRDEIDDAVNDIILVALAKKFRDRLAYVGPSMSRNEVEPNQPTGRKGDRLYCSRTPSEFLNCLKQLNPRQRRSMTEIGFGGVLDFDIKEIPRYLAYWVLNALHLARCQIKLAAGEYLTLDEEDTHLTLGFPRGPK
ncbi:uncharacterized protein LOC121771459 [Salvia splendens]|uniref:uncharacterized protein LOC121771459 n=1 Tax=Salvia splendens TaxID=180675 RepID=UPI001C26835C|nr:uncharacterized protein LOC121771459 [Salvia splendens]